MDPFVWTGDLRDDCTAVANGLMLRVEMMDRARWWWAIYADEGRKGSEQLAASYDVPPYNAKSGKAARLAAEIAAHNILSSRG